MGDILKLPINNNSSDATSDTALNNLLIKCQKYLNQEQVYKIKIAYEFSKKSHSGQVRAGGEPYISHPVSVALILAEMKMDVSSIIAAILHDVVEDTDISSKNIENNFGKEVAKLVDGVTKLDHISFSSKAEEQAENFSKMMLAMSKDLRVILLKLADRLHNMRTSDFLSIEKKKRKAKETLEIYVPIALRLGMNALRLELEELSFKSLCPLRYRIIVEAVKKNRGNKRKIVDKTKINILNRLNDIDIKATIIGREKNPYSIYKKMKRKRASFKDVYDIYGFRVIVPSIDACYRSLGAIHNLYKPVPGRFKDYIAIPKSNGYQAIHTVLFGPNAIPIEIQIKTRDMDQFAKSGIASHWQYKSTGHSAAQAFARDWLKSIIEMQKSTSNSFDFLENVKVDLFPDEVYVFTPQGEIKQLPYGASVIDYAYAVHTDIGNKCISAEVDRINVPLSTTLSSGQTVKIITSPLGKPNPSWLEFVVTAKARTNIKSYLRNLQDTQAEDLGRRILEKALNDYGTSYNNVSKELINKVLSDYDVPNIKELFIGVGLGNIIPHLVAKDLTNKETILSKNYKDWLIKFLRNKPKQRLAIKGTEGMVINYAKCCHPIPGDDIVGLMSSGNGFMVHRSGCHNIKKNPKKKINIEWSEKIQGDYPVDIRVTSNNERGVLAKVAETITNSSCNIENVRFYEVDSPFASFSFIIDVKDRTHLAEVIKNLRKLENINKVTRTLG